MSITLFLLIDERYVNDYTLAATYVTLLLGSHYKYCINVILEKDFLLKKNNLIQFN
jgi:hypothetical protein